MSRRQYREEGTIWNYGEPMPADTRETFFRDRYARKHAVAPDWHRGTADPLERRPFFALGTARKIGWALAIWRNEIARKLYMDRAREALTNQVVLPLP